MVVQAGCSTSKILLYRNLSTSNVSLCAGYKENRRICITDRFHSVSASADPNWHISRTNKIMLNIYVRARVCESRWTRNTKVYTQTLTGFTFIPAERARLIRYKTITASEGYVCWHVRCRDIRKKSCIYFWWKSCKEVPTNENFLAQLNLKLGNLKEVFNSGLCRSMDN